MVYIGGQVGHLFAGLNALEKNLQRTCLYIGGS